MNFDDWQFFQAEGLRQELASALERLLRGHSALGAYRSAIPYARRWMALDPLHEPAQRELMRLYALAGQRAAAVRQYAECQRVLELELGVAPEEETTRLFQAIRARRSVSAERSSGLPQPAESRFSLPVRRSDFAGREAVLTGGHGRLQAVKLGRLTPAGHVGIGRTHLAVRTGAVQLHNQEGAGFSVLLDPSRPAESGEPAAASEFIVSSSDTAGPRQQLLGHLGERALLLLLHNFQDFRFPTPVLSNVEGAGEREGGGISIQRPPGCSRPQDPGHRRRESEGAWRVSPSVGPRACPERSIDACRYVGRCRPLPCCPVVHSCGVSRATCC